MTDEIARAALLALTYRELYANFSAVGPRENGSEIVYDLETEREDISLLTMIGSSGATDLDWVVVRAFDRPDVLSSLLKDLMTVDPVRAEAILHALAAGLSVTRLPWENGNADSFEGVIVPADLTLIADERWLEIEETMECWRDLGLTSTRGDVFSVYLNAMEEATGSTREAIIYDFVDESATKYEAREAAGL